MRDYHSPKRDSEAEKTRSRIVAAAARRLRTGKGGKSLSLQGIATDAGVTRVTVYKQFGSRRGLLEAVFDEVARRGGLHRLPEALAEKDPDVAMRRIIAIFCEFWYFNRKAMGQILGAGAADPLLEAAIRERNERRRGIINVILKRMPGIAAVPPESVNDVVDSLFVLTSHGVFAGLEGRGRDVATVCRIVEDLAMRAIDRLKAG
jgi:AcrR family transcriptional regulator